MLNGYFKNTASRISDCLHENLENKKVSFIVTESEGNKRNTDNLKNGNSHRINHSIELKQARILIGESEKELQSLFKAYLDLLGAESDIVDNGNRALSTFLQNKNNGKKYDAVVLDTHLKGKKGLHVAKKIRQSDNSQKIILITTSMKEQLPENELQAASIDGKDILVMPFALSNLSKMIVH